MGHDFSVPCTKNRHPSKEMADAFIAYLAHRKSEVKRKAKRLTAYECPYPGCRGYWHIGHDRFYRGES